jgi:methionyl-tRNA synthetase
MQLAQTHLEKPVELEYKPFPKEYSDALGNFEINKAADVVWERIKLLDQQITDTEPFKVIKSNPEEGKELIAALVVELAFIDQMLEPLMPQTSKKIIDAIVANKKPDNLFARKD